MQAQDTDKQARRVYDRLRHATPGSTHLYLVRHGQTAGNVGQQLIGHTDMPLDELGLRQARQVGLHMQSLPLDAIVSSPLTRAYVTALEIAGHQRIDVEVDDRLREMHFGYAEGLTMIEAVERYPAIMALQADPLDEDFAWPGGDIRSGFHAAVMATFADIASAHLGRHTAVVCHGGVIGSLLAQLDGGSPNDHLAYPVANCSVTHLEVHLGGTTAHRLNDIGHLDVVHTEPWTWTTASADPAERQAGEEDGP